VELIKERIYMDGGTIWLWRELKTLDATKTKLWPEAAKYAIAYLMSVSE
jgi:hypothetical protein